MKRQSLLYLIMAALLAALITALTYYGRIPFPMTSDGYVHLGDGVVYIAAALLPGPYAAAAAAIGCGLADLGCGYFSWIPATVLLKACMALLFTSKRPNMLNRRNILALLPAAVINVGGYFLYESLTLHHWAAMVSAVGNVIQSVLGALLFVLLAAALDHLQVKTRFMR